MIDTYCAIYSQAINLSKFQLMISPKVPIKIKNQIRALTQT